MVEYAILVAGSSLRGLAADISNFSDNLNWTLIGYAALALVALRVVTWAFRPTR